MRISIHAPRAGGDRLQMLTGKTNEISIHAPRAGGDTLSTARAAQQYEFQSTPPVRGATFLIRGFWTSPEFQSTPPVRGATWCKARNCDVTGISIHAPRAGGDLPVVPPAEGLIISIHAPRAGGDWTSALLASTSEKFQSTPPVRGATAKTAKIQSFFHDKIDVPLKYPLLVPIRFQKQDSLSTETTVRFGAKLRRSPVCLHFAPKASAHLPGHRMPLPQNARSCSRTGFPSNKSAGCPSPGP